MYPLFALLVLLFWSAAGQATPALPDYSAQRGLFQEAREALRAQDSDRYQTLLKKLKGYPLTPYLSYWDLRGRLRKVGTGEVHRFLKEHADLYLADRLRAAWLDELARRGDWKGYVRDYHPGLGTELACTYHQALLKSGRTHEALEGVETLWLSGRSVPKACDPVFEAWRQAGKQTRQRVWARIHLAMAARQTGLARYLGRFLPENERAWLDQWIQVDRDPKRLLHDRLHPDAHPQAKAILGHGLYRLARVEPAAAATLWEQLSPDHFLDQKQLHSIERAIATGLAGEDDPQAEKWLKQAGAHDPEVVEWAARRAVSRGDWPRLLRLLGQMPLERSAEGDWRYWRARALQEGGAREEAKKLLADLAQERSYYGFLAADRLGVGYQFQEQPLQVPDATFERLLKLRPGLVRAHELLLLDERLEARREWYAALSGLADEALQAAALLAHQWGWHDRAILTLARTSHNDDLSLRFPMPYRDLVHHAAEQQSLDPAWVFAMLRQESAFGSDARSPAGAMGLMQLMPSTARLVARDLKTPLRRTTALFEPDLNITLGTAYLRRVLDRHGSNPVLATAAYNAGPHRVDRWLPETGSVPAEQWVESVPFTETRNYVKRIFAYTPIYERQLGRKITPLSRRMPTVSAADANPE